MGVQMGVSVQTGGEGRLRVSARACAAVCQLLPKGVVSVLGPAHSPSAAATVSHICGEKEVRGGGGRVRGGVNVSEGV